MSMYDDRTTRTYREDENRNNTGRWIAIIVLVLLALAALYLLTRPAADPNAVNDPNNALTGQEQTGGELAMPTPMDANTGAEGAAGDTGAVTGGETAGDPALATPLGAEGGADMGGGAADTSDETTTGAGG